MNVFTLSMRIAILALVLLGTVACGKSDKSRSMGTLDANSSGIDGSVPAGAERIYTLRGIKEFFEYTLRTTVTNADLVIGIYKSEADYKNDPLNVVAPAKPVVISFTESYPTTTYYEAHFTANAGQSGDYVVVLKASQSSAQADQFFYDLRLMSPSVPVSAATLTAGTSIVDRDISAGVIHIYSDTSITSAATYSITLVSSNVTVTASHPQLFIYTDKNLLLENLLISSISSTLNFIVTDFTLSGAGVITGTTRTTDPENAIKPGRGVLLSPVTFSSTGPYIMVKGAAAAKYTLTISP